MPRQARNHRRQKEEGVGLARAEGARSEKG